MPIKMVYIEDRVETVQDREVCCPYNELCTCKTVQDREICRPLTNHVHIKLYKVL
jgi:hypothetical protein